MGDELTQLCESDIAMPQPGALQRVMSGVSQAVRRPARRRGIAAGLVAVLPAAAIVATLLVACGNQPTVAGNNPTGVIPWLPLPAQLEAPVGPSPMPSPLPTGIQPCTQAQLQVSVLGSNGAGGQVFIGFGFSGRGTTACFVQGTPAVALFDPSGRLLPFAPRPLFSGPVSSGPVLVEPGPLPDPNTNLKTGQAALTIDWISQPEQCQGSAGVQIAMAEITLPSGGPALTMTLPTVPGAYTCQGLGIGAFEGPPPPVEEPAVLPLPAIALKVPSTVPAGGVLVYEVRLTNDKSQPMDLVANCPNYGEELFPNDPHSGPPRSIKPLFRLNCTPAGTILPAAGLIFEIRLAVPKDEPPGAYKLFFTLGYWNAMTTPVSTPVTINQ
jgi:Protein of unknown function (DUF4232)